MLCEYSKLSNIEGNNAIFDLGFESNRTIWQLRILLCSWKFIGAGARNFIEKRSEGKQH